jgi:hypothetical protein
MFRPPRDLPRPRRKQARRFEAQVAWILGSPRSGSSWLTQMLGVHESIWPIHEPMIGWYLGPFVADLPGMDPARISWRHCTLPRFQHDTPSQFFADEFKEAWLPGLRRLILERLEAEVMRQSDGRFGARSMVVVKEPNGSQAADLILEALPRSTLIFLLRDGRDVVDSQLAAMQRGGWAAPQEGGEFDPTDARVRWTFLRDSAYKWLWRTEVVMDAYGRHPGPKHLVRYEDLLANPTRELRSILGLLGLPDAGQQTEAIAAEYSFDRLPAEQKGPLKFVRAAQPGLWRENLTGDEQAMVGEIVGPKLRELGYEP